MKKKILLIILTLLLILTGCSKKEKENAQVLETNGMLSYTIDGESTSEQPTKESGYIVNKILCDSDMDLMWDNDNWEVEFTNISSGKCTIDFTKDTSTQGYRITVTSNNPSSLDSLSKATVENGTVKIYSKSTIKSVTGCNASIEDNKIIVSNVIENQTCNIVVEQTLNDAILAAYPPKAGRTDFTTIDNGTPALYTGTDDQGTTYYFSGDGSQMNNWVSYAGKMWRIIRINGNGSVRMLYAGDGNDATDIGTSAFNSEHNDPMYAGWKYGTSGTLANNRTNKNKSTIYEAVESWYNSLSSTDKDYLDASAIYCNDREIANGYLFSASSRFFYAARSRLESDNKPTFKCTNSSDRFTGNNSIPIGLMTADEIVAAGGLYDKNSPKAYFYLTKNGSSNITIDSYWWTMSPAHWNGSNTGMFIVYNSRLYYYGIKNELVVRPVVSLKKEVLVTGGSGTGSDPYTVKMP